MPNNYVLLDRIELNASAASVVFDNIPQSGYTDLKIVASVRSTAGSEDISLLSLNGSTTGFSARYLQGNGASASSSTLARWGGNFTASNNTANTFGSAELYFPNYLSSNQKSYSVDNVTETNGTTAYAGIVAGLWTGTSAINSITFTPAAGSYVANSTFSLYGLAQVGTTPAIAPKADGGNVIGTDGTYWYHAFLSNGTFTPQVGLNCDLLVVAGGGGGGTLYGGGGGGGGWKAPTAQTLAISNYSVVVGSGGAVGSAGVASSINSISATGGGFGGNFPTGAGGTGGSGGGGGGTSPDGAAGAATSGEGNVGGAGKTDSGTWRRGGGGGGAGAAGVAGGNTSGATGGIGSSVYTSWLSVVGAGQNSSGTYYYSGGGGGGGLPSTGTYTPAGGLGGGGAGGSLITGGGGVSGVAGTANSGGGGGGAETASGTGAAGGSGFVIIRYLVA